MPLAGRGFHPAGLPFTDLGEFIGPDVVGIDPAATLSFADVLELRADRASRVRSFLAGVGPDELSREVDGPPWAGGRLTVLRCLRVVLNEEFEHHRFAERDLDLMGVPENPAEDVLAAATG